MKNIINKTTTILAQMWTLVVALAQLAAAYVFTTQENEILMVVGGIIGMQASITLVSKFINGDK